MLGVEAGIGDVKKVLQWGNDHWLSMALIIMLIFCLWVIYYLVKNFMNPKMREAFETLNTMGRLLTPLQKIADDHPSLAYQIRELTGKINESQNMTQGFGRRMDSFEEALQKMTVEGTKHRDEQKERIIKLETKVEILMKN